MVVGIKKREIKQMSELFEVLMLVCFGISWPISVIKSIKSKSSQGKSLIFTIVIIIGYICGIISKVTAGNTTYVLWFYIFNLVVVSIDLAVSAINKSREHKDAGTANKNNLRSNKINQRQGA